MTMLPIQDGYRKVVIYGGYEEGDQVLKVGIGHPPVFSAEVILHNSQSLFSICVSLSTYLFSLSLTNTCFLALNSVSIVDSPYSIAVSVIPRLHESAFANYMINFR